MSSRWNRRSGLGLSVVLLSVAAATCLASAVGAEAAKIRLREATFGSAAQPTFGEINGLTTDYSSGDLLVTDAGANEEQDAVVEASGGTYELCFDPDEGGPQEVECTEELPVDAKQIQIRGALEGLAGIGVKNVEVFGGGTGSPTRRTIEFVRALAQTKVPQLECEGEGLEGTSPSCSVTTSQEWHPPRIARFKPNGEPDPFSALGSNVIDAEAGPGGKPCAEEPASCDRNPEHPGLSFAGPLFGGVAIDESGTATDGDIYVTQEGKHLIDVFAADGSFIGQLSEYLEPTRNEEQQFANPGSSATYEITIPGYGTTAQIVGNVSGSDVCALYINPVLEGALGPGAHCEGVGAAGGKKTITFIGALANTNVATMEVKELSPESKSIEVKTLREGGPAPEPLGQPCGVAVDGGGALYVADFEAEEKLFKYASQGAPHNPLTYADNTEKLRTRETELPCHLAAGAGPSAGSLFSAPPAGSLAKLSYPGGALEYCEIVSGLAVERAIAVDPETGHLFAAANGFSTAGITEYDPSAGACASEVSSAPAALAYGIAAVKGSEELYVAEATPFSGGLLTYKAKKVVIYGPPLPIPDARTGEATEIGAHEATLTGTVDPAGAPLTECSFEWGTTTAYGHAEPCAESLAQIGSGEGPVEVHLNLEGLEVETAYHFRLLAKNANTTGEGGAPPQVTGEDQSLATSGKPVIEALRAKEVGSSEATLEARISPGGVPSTYRFEWGPDTEPYAHETADLPLGSDAKPHTVELPLSGLTPGASYRFRVSAANEFAPPGEEVISEDHRLTTYVPFAPDTACPNQAYRTGPGASLPDCRAYEMVSPLDKGGGDIIAAGNKGRGEEAAYRRAAAEGSAVTYTSTTAFGDAQRGAIANQYLSERGPEGWSTQGLNPPQGQTVFDPNPSLTYDLEIDFLGFSPDLCAALVKDDNYTPLTEDAIQGFTNLYLRDDCGEGAGGYEAVTRGAAPAFSEKPEDLQPSQATVAPDSGAVVFGATAALESSPAAAEAASYQLYELVGGELHLVSALPGGKAAQADAGVGSESGDREAPLEAAVSEDGSRVYWSTEGKLYLRENAAAAAEECATPQPPDRSCTTQVSAGAATFETASRNGEAAIYRKGEALWRYDAASGTSTKIAGGAGGTGAVAGASADLSHLYFTSSEALVEGAPELSVAEREAGEANLYLDREGQMTFIATLSGADRGVGTSHGPGADRTLPFEHDARASADGRALAFMSDSTALAKRTAEFDNRDAVTGEPASEAYLYEAGAGGGEGRLLCVSCNPSGAAPMGQTLRRAYNAVPSKLTNLRAASWLPTCEWGNYCNRTLAADGRRLFFDSYDSLLPADKNEAQDVYEWEAAGVGDCREGGSGYFPRNGGCLALISTGRSPADSSFVDASPDGRDVFFTTSSSIDPRDEGSVDLYDARVQGGFAAPAEAPECAGDACQAAPPAPRAITPASSLFEGPGDLPEAKKRCPKGKRLVRRAGKSRCVRRHRRHAHHRHRRRHRHRHGGRHR